MSNENDEDVSEIYTNSVNVQSGLYEVVLRLHNRTPGEESEGENGKEVARVRMSPQLAKALQLILEKQLETYGDQFEEIYLPDELVEQLAGGEVEEEST